MDPSLEVYLLLADFHELGHAGLERHRPLPPFPIVGGLGLQRIRPRVGRRVREHGLHERRADARAATPRHGPDVIGQYPQRPRTDVAKRAASRTETPFF